MKRKGTAKRSNSQRRAVNRFRLFVVLTVLDVLLIVGTLLMLPMALQSVDEATGKHNAWFGVESITVKGNTRYDDETIIAVSGIVEGKSVFSISERNAEQYIRDTFSYIKDVSVDVAMGGDVTITVTEHKELGTVYANGSWMVVSDEGIGLMQMPVESERPYRRLYLKGADILSPKVGAKVIGGKDLEIANLLVKSMAANGLHDVGIIDLSNRSDIRLNWKNQIEIAMGNDSNLNYEVAVAVGALPTVLNRHGETATGVLNLSQYSDETIDSPMVIFTPTELLNTEKPAPEGDKTDSDSPENSPEE